MDNLYKFQKKVAWNKLKVGIMFDYIAKAADWIEIKLNKALNKLTFFRLVGRDHSASFSG